VVAARIPVTPHARVDISVPEGPEVLVLYELFPGTLACLDVGYLLLARFPCWTDLLSMEEDLTLNIEVLKEVRQLRRHQPFLSLFTAGTISSSDRTFLTFMNIGMYITSFLLKD
jgi:hypothetical protein